MTRHSVIRDRANDEATDLAWPFHLIDEAPLESTNGISRAGISAQSHSTRSSRDEVDLMTAHAS